ncbi:response regulator [Candidatus Kuenenbacteria bacterium CG_4_9_14_3_um_filter_39_14]|uniref:Response regulator n=3 Tax=Candidatus Kueneniibacteriota TaxID=1752740 RepID=A0A2M7IMC5_9BACT|nr:response regulator [Candidatus Kuenenbacteria bacterium]PIW95918.1 MAG: response regulator [Candidatus Kuenenbacteria bacterium CG_4_8_14_3_um_filter_39_15]PIX92101.1 MAG: response regulator [Candidatus Kuenenbacteria bacterium CG_4_10_14_3_um_filter_39_14]PJA92104.1 MAG: response regulator [Candidatus Kuenenbacteria bacterium CG_4_9_14_3_um_filter_39_14]
MSKKILIVEDETALLYALQNQLSVEGYQTLAADNGEKALQILEREKPNAILLDIILPKMDGWTFLQKIKSNEKTKDIPVIIVSNLSDEASQAHGIELGAKDYLVKTNYTTAELVDKIKQLTK